MGVEVEVGVDVEVEVDVGVGVAVGMTGFNGVSVDHSGPAGEPP